MDGYIQTGIGVFISVVLFLVGYRQTIGARRERIGSANRAVYKALLRRLVLEDYSPKVDDLNRLIEGKAQEFKVAPSDLHADEQVLNQVFAEIFDNDFIAPSKRSEIEGRLTGALDQLARGRQRIDDSRLVNPDQERRRALLLITLGFLASLMGALASLFLLGENTLQLGGSTSTVKTFLPVLTVFVASLVSVVAISFVKRVREAPDEVPSRSNAAVESALLEHQVAAILSKHHIPYQIEPKIGMLRPDFVAQVGNERVAIEVKSWRSPPPLAVASRAARYMLEVLRSGNINRAIVVTRGRLPALDNIRDADGVQFVAIKDLEDWIKSVGSI